MSRLQAGLQSSRTAYYDLLEVSEEASEQELKRAYRKKALRVHPDKGGDPDEFRCIKQAYDVLLDPRKRKAYDQYGEAAVTAMEGNITLDVAMAIMLHLGKKERMMVILGLTAIVGYLLLFPVLLCLRWDDPTYLTFAQVFVPVWIALVAVLVICFCVIRAPAADPDEDDEEMRGQIEEMQRHAGVLRVTGSVGVLILFALLLFLVLRLDGDVKWSYWIVLSPWLLLEFFMVGIKLQHAGVSFVMSGGNPDILIAGNKWLTSAWNCYILTLVRRNIFHLGFACLVCLKLQGSPMSWWLVFSPIWVDWGISIIGNLLMCAEVKSREERDAMSDEARAAETSRGSICCLFIMQMIFLGSVVLCCRKLVDNASISAFIVFAPVFVGGCCLCCCLSCIVAFMAPREHGEERAASSSSRTQLQASAYGSFENVAVRVAMAPKIDVTLRSVPAKDGPDSYPPV